MIGKRLLAVTLLGLGALGTVGCSEREHDAAIQVEGAELTRCGDLRADTGVLQRLRESDESLRKALAGGRSNAVAEAHKALDAGDFRLAAATTETGITTEPYGVQCRVLGGLSPWTVRALAFVAADKAAADDELPDDKVMGFGRRYNAAMLADPRYPYADVCRATDKAGPVPPLPDNPDAGVVQPFGFAELGPARMSHGLGAAARRGSVSDIRVLLGRDAAAVDRTDMFGLTPLAWAVAYHRWPAAEALLRAKANPTGATCQTTIDRQSPLQIARIMRWYAMIRRMRPLVSEEEFASLRQKPRWDDASLIEFNHALTELKERYERVLRRQAFRRHDLDFQVDEQGNTTECTMEPASVSPAFDKELCGLAVEIVRWTPARDAFGTRVPESAKLLVGFGGGN
ncbi:ankyrin repeat domain-containing protein [Novosphingobium soli]|uniref:Ankyrin repeat domain-containing protein n=1 Tax=Novosphingobium soli TaxID=574956 RepID=A0ABV6CUM1_9SPHN